MGGGRRHTASQENGQEKKEKMGMVGWGEGEEVLCTLDLPPPPKPFSLPPSLYLLLLTLSPRSACTRNVTISPFFCSLLSLPPSRKCNISHSFFVPPKVGGGGDCDEWARKKERKRSVVCSSRERERVSEMSFWVTKNSENLSFLCLIDPSLFLYSLGLARVRRCVTDTADVNKEKKGGGKTMPPTHSFPHT